MTNLLGSIALVVVTNWVTVTVDNPDCHALVCTNSHYETHYQSGTIVTNAVLNMMWKDQKREFVLESSQPGYISRVGKVTVAHTKMPPLLIAKPKK